MKSESNDNDEANEMKKMANMTINVYNRNEEENGIENIVAAK